MHEWQEEDVLILSNLTGLPMSTNYTGPSRLASSIGAAVMLLFFIEGMIGNLWIVIAVMSKRQIWNIINLFIASLCFNELLVMSLTVYVIIDSYIWMEWTAGELMCKLGPEFTIAFTGCSLWHTAFIAIHRYIVVVHNDAYKRMSKKAYVTFVLVVARLIPFACTFPGFSNNTSGYVPKLLRCIILPNQKARVVSITMVQIVAPCIIVALCYIFIFGFVVKIRRQIQNSSLMMQREIQITKMFGVIFLMILLGFFPYAAVRNADRENQLHADVYVIVSVFYSIATCSSPLIYGTMSTEIRNMCMACLKNSGFVKCLPCCSELWERACTRNCSQTFSNATIMDDKDQIEVRDAQTQIENGAAPGDKLIPMKTITDKHADLSNNGEATLMEQGTSRHNGGENGAEEEHLLQGDTGKGGNCNQDGDLDQTDRISVMEIGENNVESHIVIHKQLSIGSDTEVADIKDYCNGHVSPSSDNEIVISDNTPGRTEVAILSNGCGTLVAAV